MPELPEIETLRRLLQVHLVGARIESVVFTCPVILRAGSPEAFAAHVVGRRITHLERRAKYLALRLEDEGTPAGSIVIHLRMRGSLRVMSADLPPDPYLCATLRLVDGRELRYHDMWRWGEWWPLRSDEPLQRLRGIALLGPEPFDPAFTPEFLARRLAARRAAIKPLLLTQRLVAGLGNLYADECLHHARLNPATPAASLGVGGAARLHAAIQEVLAEALEQGAALAALLAAQGEDLLRFDAIYEPRVYDRPGFPCPTCGQRLIKITLCGRGTTYCPFCQPTAANAISGQPEP
jgi:formamidopyrimidine-DNA glycosylase